MALLRDDVRVHQGLLNGLDFLVHVVAQLVLEVLLKVCICLWKYFEFVLEGFKQLTQVICQLGVLVGHHLEDISIIRIVAEGIQFLVSDFQEIHLIEEVAATSQASFKPHLLRKASFEEVEINQTLRTVALNRCALFIELADVLHEFVEDFDVLHYLLQDRQIFQARLSSGNYAFAVKPFYNALSIGIIDSTLLVAVLLCVRPQH
jgi:hypothetical protein